uniref:Small ribosomal subunit protein mS39 n=1 Tax=Gongylonema pulchrum TaxID=637853 RepID=A0A183DI23_9BILA
LLFEELEKNEEIYSLMIAGLCKYRSSECVARATQLYKEMCKKNQTPTVEAYCGLVAISRTWPEALFYVKDCAQKHVKPNIRIFNCLIEKSTSMVSPLFQYSS